MDNIDRYLEKISELLLDYAPKVLMALLVLWVGLRVIKVLMRAFRNMLEKREVDITLRKFLSNLVGTILKVLLFVSVIQMLGVATTSFVAIIGAAGLAIGLALQGTLANFAGGVLILLFRPYNVGDLISAQGETGVVRDIKLFTTTLTTAQNRTVIIPNGPMANGNITNFTVAGQLRVDLTIGISYNSNIKEARQVLLDVLQRNDKILKEPAPVVSVVNLNDSSVDLAVRPWCAAIDYWDVHFWALEECKIALDAANIEIPFPQRDVHLKQKN